MEQEKRENHRWRIDSSRPLFYQRSPHHASIQEDGLTLVIVDPRVFEATTREIRTGEYYPCVVRPLTSFAYDEEQGAETEVDFVIAPTGVVEVPLRLPRPR
jgi:hypothetical protein